MPCSPRTENESHLHFHSSLLSFFFLSPKLRENFLKLQFYLKKKSPNGKNFSESKRKKNRSCKFSSNWIYCCFRVSLRRAPFRSVSKFTPRSEPIWTLAFAKAISKKEIVSSTGSEIIDFAICVFRWKLLAATPAGFHICVYSLREFLENRHVVCHYKHDLQFLNKRKEKCLLASINTEYPSCDIS